MKLKDLQDVCREAELLIDMHINLLSHGDHERPEEAIPYKLMLADLTLLHHELLAHIEALESILTVCKAVAAGRYREEWQQCSRWSGSCHGCTSSDACDSFDGREPHEVVAERLAELSPLSDVTRQWMLFQVDYQRQRRALIFGPGGFLGNATRVMPLDEGSGILTPLSEEGGRPRGRLTVPRRMPPTNPSPCASISMTSTVRASPICAPSTGICRRLRRSSSAAYPRR